MNTQPVDETHDLSSDHRPVSFELAVAADGRPPARTTCVAAHRLPECPIDKAAQLAYSEWLLARLTA